MKSILVDALREANGTKSESTLSDSGSFDATQSEFGPTANDEEVVPLAAPDENLELLRTASFHTDDFDSELDTEFPEQSMAATRAIDAAVLAAIQSSARTPVLARYAPLICIAVAIVSAGSWAVYQHYATTNHDTRIGAAEFRLGPGVNHDGVESTARDADRFPFIDLVAEADAGATPE